MSWGLDLLRDLLLAAGSLAILIGATGILRFPEFFTRIHAAGVTETAGIGLITAGLLIEAGWSLVSVKLLIILAFMLLTGPTASHALAKAAMHGGMRPHGFARGNKSSKS